jgi:hypothetical protein
MTAIDWTIRAKLLERQDGGSDMYFDFTQVNEGTLAPLVKEVAGLPSEQRARIVIDAGPLGTLGLTEILALANRDDFPSE